MNSNGNIHFGSIEESERSRLSKSNSNETTTISFEKPKPRTDQVLEHSKESMEAKKKHEELTKRLELQKKAKNIIVPTSENDVKAQLRELKQVVTYFAETAAMRRDRLKGLLAKIMMETGSAPVFKKQKVTNREDNDDYYFYEGSKELQKAREDIAKYSFKEAAIRVEMNKIRKETIDPVEEEEIIDQELMEIPKYEMSMCQFADPSCV